MKYHLASAIPAKIKGAKRTVCGVEYMTDRQLINWRVARHGSINVLPADSDAAVPSITCVVCYTRAHT